MTKRSRPVHRLFKPQTADKGMGAQVVMKMFHVRVLTFYFRMIGLEVRHDLKCQVGNMLQAVKGADRNRHLKVTQSF